MKARHILVCLTLFLLGVGLLAQDNELPQTFSPNAAELGRYGNNPVNYFNGFLNISIPQTVLYAKNYMLPDHLTCQASGNQYFDWASRSSMPHAGGRPSARRARLTTNSPRTVIDSLAPIVVRVFPMEYSYDAAGNRIKRTVQNGINPPVFPPVIDTLNPIEPPVGGGAFHP